MQQLPRALWLALLLTSPGGCGDRTEGQPRVDGLAASGLPADRGGPPDAGIEAALSCAEGLDCAAVGACEAGPCGDGGCAPACNCEATSPRPVPPAVHALPEAGEAPFVELLQGARSSIRVMVYLMGYGGILDTLIAKAEQGVEVRVILDEGKRSVNQKYYDKLEAAGAEVIWSDPKFRYMHAKMIVVDRREALLTTGNFSTKYSIERERNFAVRISDADDVADMVSLFDADWQGVEPELSCTRLLVSPVNARERLLELIDSATSELAIESMQFAEKEVRAHVAARKAAGVKVRAILAEPSWIDANEDAAAFLDELGIEVRSIPHCHTKVIIADGARAFVGSENLSYTSLTKNREVGVVLTSSPSIAVLADTFEQDWLAGTPL